MFGFYTAAGRSISAFALKFAKENSVKKPVIPRRYEEYADLIAAAEAGSGEASWQLGMVLSKYYPYKSLYFLNMGREFINPQDVYTLGIYFCGQPGDSGMFMEIGILCLKYAEAKGLKKAGIYISEIYAKELSYPSSAAEARRYKRIKMGKKVSDLNDERIENKNRKLRNRRYYTQNGENIHAEVFRMELL